MVSYPHRLRRDTADDVRLLEKPEVYNPIQQNQKNRNEGQGDGDPKNTSVGPFPSPSLSRKRVGGAAQASHGGEVGEERFHGTKRKVEEEAAVTGKVVPDDLALMAKVAGNVSCGLVYRAGLGEAHLRFESNQAYLIED
ncbi:hypothetical protein M9H77_16008 [Catharanthus roseus]|uniref:Uncharacterized protein n=1 Tax=Catharanthus roseus TaxID=4058 RepID=A0ACC0B0G4_CATRO|nr:hypothetical protein M9H77_16008 [Catharanthus roseus]